MTQLDGAPLTIGGQTQKKSITMTSSNDAPTQHTFSMNIANKDHSKFLGVVIDKHFTMKNHIDHILSRTKLLMYASTDLKKSQLPRAKLVNLYGTCVHPAWSTMITWHQKVQIERVVNITLKVFEIVTCPLHIHRLFNICARPVV